MPEIWSSDRNTFRWPLATLLVLSISPGVCGEDAPSQIEIKDHCKLIWRSINSFQFECNEFEIDDSGEPDLARGHNRYRFWQGMGGRRAMIAEAVHPDRVELATEFHQDGQRRYTVNAYPGHPNTIERISIADQPGTEDYYEAVMNQVIWLLMPAGKPTHAHIEEGAKVSVAPRSPVGRYIDVIGQHRGQPLRITLDSQRDWMPIEVAQEGRFRIVATEFGRDNGRWFPTAGRKEDHRKSGVRHTGFEVIGFRINREQPASIFKMPQVEDGVIVADATGNAARVRIVGGEGAKLVRDQMFARPQDEQASGPPLRVPRSGGTNALGFGVALVGVIALLAAIVIHFHRKLKGN